MPVRLDHSLVFPDPQTADAQGLVAIGGDLSTDRLLAAYRAGIFPWSARPTTWWSPDPRGIFELEHVHISESLRRVLKQNRFEVTRDQAFGEVIRACAAPGPGRLETWITAEFVAGYEQLHRAGHAHSVECWEARQLVGGVYGVTVGGLFAGESMFHRTSNASKVALCHLLGHLRERGFTLFDTQMVTSATAPLGAVAISRRDYLARLAVAVQRATVF
jgi:leucyl/phenylalanyl-tRNA---protein transferase